VCGFVSASVILSVNVKFFHVLIVTRITDAEPMRTVNIKFFAPDTSTLKMVASCSSETSVSACKYYAVTTQKTTIR
jgi:hypothetical protein